MDWLRSFFSGGITPFITVPKTVSFVVDVLAMAYAIYKIMSWIRQTRAWSLFKGFLIVVAVYLISVELNMITVQWVMRATFSVGLITVVILFQPELRKALEQLGKGKIYKTFTISDKDDNAKLTERTENEILTAMAQMSKSMTGVLIVIERDVPLGEHEQTGTQIDAVVSSRLLMNIFVDKTPLHDGAVIIKNNRIAAASCILPLTQTEIGLDLGTRHRAAVGISEVSDAIVLVVSEETGAMSVAYNGALRRGLTEAEIRAQLAKSGAAGSKRPINWRKKRAKDVT
ncbi:MAG: diadenylate cyclase CdaA [Defluviitaleaceae bacterium]|nr:diadenylate cyclase CdaA [Defluviitaleaceae bacterium]